MNLSHQKYKKNALKRNCVFGISEWNSSDCVEQNSEALQLNTKQQYYGSSCHCVIVIQTKAQWTRRTDAQQHNNNNPSVDRSLI